MAMREVMASAMKWWEPRRLVYNAALALLVLARFYQGYPATRSALFVNNLLVLFVLAVLANVAYCAAYLPDLYIQLAGHDEVLAKGRWGIFAVGTAFAMVLTHFWSYALLGMN